jgi:hypothetical protein
LKVFFKGLQGNRMVVFTIKPKSGSTWEMSPPRKMEQLTQLTLTLLTWGTTDIHQEIGWITMGEYYLLQAKQTGPPAEQQATCLAGAGPQSKHAISVRGRDQQMGKTHKARTM